MIIICAHCCQRKEKQTDSSDHGEEAVAISWANTDDEDEAADERDGDDDHEADARTYCVYLLTTRLPKRAPPLDRDRDRLEL